MDILRHLETSARVLALPRERLREYVLGFTVPSTRGFRRQLPTRAPAYRVLRAAEHLLRLDGFDVGTGPDYESHRLAGRWEEECDRNQGWLGQVSGLTQRRLPLRFTVEGKLAEGCLLLTASHDLRSWLDDFCLRLREDLSAVGERPGPGAQVLGPGQELTGPFAGRLRDYSGCATREEVADLRGGTLPLGRWRCGDELGEGLTLADSAEGQGVLVCAPQNSGKTALLCRWAEAARRGGVNTLVVDVKGNLRAKLRGPSLHFTTDPGVACDRLNFLRGIDLSRGHPLPDGSVRTDPREGLKIRQLVAALLPDDGCQGEEAFYHQNQVRWLTALVHVLKLREAYFPEAFPGRGADLSDLYDLVAWSDNVHNFLADLQAAEDYRRAHGGLRVQPGARYWFNELVVLLDPQRGGRRTPEHPYETLTLAMQNALRPFSEFGSLYRKIRDVPTFPEDERHVNFDLSALDGREPCTIVLAAREQDVGDAETVLALVMRRLQQLLFERFAGDPAHRRILLLLDETRRIRGFKPAEYVSYAREARAGCVLVYQSLDQIGEESEVLELLENVGTQVYLKSVTGRSCEHLLRVLPRRWRPTYTLSSTRGSAGATEAVQTGHEEVDYFTRQDLFALPAGPWPGLVWLRGRKPILVDLEEHGQV